MHSYLEQKLEKKDLRIETMRGLACLLLVAFHVIGSDPASGLKVTDDSGWRFFSETFIYFRMPLFAFISGYIYALYTIKDGQFRKFYLNKVRRLGMPLLTVSTLFFIVSHIVGTVYALPLGDLYEIYIFPYAHYWYLQASLIIFLVIIALEKFSLLGEKTHLLALLFIATFISIFFDDINPNVFSINGAIYLFPFFVLGMYIKRFKNNFSKGEHVTAAIITLSLLGYAILRHLNVFSEDYFIMGKTHIFGMALSLSFCIAIYAANLKNRYLAVLGTYSFAIYLFHIFAASGARIGLGKFMPDLPLFIVFVICMIGGLIFPALLETLIAPNRVLNFLFLGGKLKRRDAAPDRLRG